MKKIGVTGANGFIGFHLCNHININKDKYHLVNFDRSFFDSKLNMQKFVDNCDVIVHLAAINRTENQNYLFDSNVLMSQKIIDALNGSKKNIHLIFASSTQENNDSSFGRSKKKCMTLFDEWSKLSGSFFTSLVIPNIFGPFCKPNYNSFISTFSHKLIHDENPVINVDAKIDLLYITDLINSIFNCIESKKKLKKMFYKSEVNTYSVSEILNKLKYYKQNYIDRLLFPKLIERFDINLFNTFRSYIDYEKFFPVNLTRHKDVRGSFVELVKCEMGGQFSFSTTESGITRGNHFHTRKIERFMVIKGKAKIQMRKYGTDKIIEFYVDGNKPTIIDIPVWYIHNLINIGSEVLYSNFWINEPYDSKDPDTYYYKV